jgi:hypothetical protein
MHTRRGFLALWIATVAVALAFAAGPALAQMKQIQLTDKQVQAFIAAQKEMAAVADKLQGTANKPDPKVQAELEGIAKKNGFAGFAEYDDVAANISLVMSGIDPQTKKFTQPPDAIKKEIEAVKADKTLKPAEKKKMLDELNEALKSAEPIQFPSNVALVTKYFDQLDVALQ